MILRGHSNNHLDYPHIPLILVLGKWLVVGGWWYGYGGLYWKARESVCICTPIEVCKMRFRYYSCVSLKVFRNPIRS